MNRGKELLGIPYAYEIGPRPVQSLTYGEIPEELNCQAAVQEFYRHVFGVYLSPPQVLSEEGFRHSGDLVVQGDTPDFFRSLQIGDIIYADSLYHTTQFFLGLSRLQKLHLAVFLGTSMDLLVKTHFPHLSEVPSTTQHIFHATIISGKTTTWDTTQFRTYYRPVAAKRVIQSL